MKTIVIFLSLVFWLNTSQAQKVILLDPVTVNYSYPEVFVHFNVNGLNLEVKEKYMNEFMDNPIGFIENKFDFRSLNIKDFIEADVIFKNSKGYLRAVYNNKGNLVRTYQKFNDIYLPRSIVNKVYLENPKYIVIGNSYTAKGTHNRIDKEVYRVKLKEVDGKKVRRLKITPNENLEDITLNKRLTKYKLL